MKQETRRPWNLSRLFCVLVILVAITSSYAFAQESTTEVTIATDPELGAHLTDANGHTLYIYLNDNHLASHCYDSCAETWPPLEANGNVSAGEGVNSKLLGTIERDDGIVQVTYNRYPLYLYVKDTEPATMSGQDFQDTWYIISPEGYRIAAGTENTN